MYANCEEGICLAKLERLPHEKTRFISSPMGST